MRGRASPWMRRLLVSHEIPDGLNAVTYQLESIASISLQTAYPSHVTTTWPSSATVTLWNRCTKQQQQQQRSIASMQRRHQHPVSHRVERRKGNTMATASDASRRWRPTELRQLTTETGVGADRSGRLQRQADGWAMERQRYIAT